MAKLFWWLAFLVMDLAVAGSLLYLLCSREQRLPRNLEVFFPLRGRWLWRFLLGVVIVAYISLSPMFLFALIRILKR